MRRGQRGGKRFESTCSLRPTPGSAHAWRVSPPPRSSVQRRARPRTGMDSNGHPRGAEQIHPTSSSPEPGDGARQDCGSGLTKPSPSLIASAKAAASSPLVGRTRSWRRLLHSSRLRWSGKIGRAVCCRREPAAGDARLPTDLRTFKRGPCESITRVCCVAATPGCIVYATERIDERDPRHQPS
jgi:hypothetical protein